MNLYKKRKKPARFAAIMAMLILSGCAAVSPDYVPPEMHVSETWHTSMKGGLQIATTQSGNLEPLVDGFP